MNIRRTHIERITITCPMEESQQARDYCDRHGYAIIRSGPKRISAARADTTRYELVAERERTLGP